MALYDYLGNPIYDDAPKLRVPWVSSSHRGYKKSTVAENTLQAFYRSYFIAKADWIEVDARLASDGVYVCNHDATVTVGGVTYTIANETSETLTSLVLSTDSDFGDCKLPTLESVLKLCLYTGMKANIDCKAIDAESLAKLVVDCGMSGRVSYANTLAANLETILEIDPNCGVVFPYTPGNLALWAGVSENYNFRQNSFAYGAESTTEILEATRAYGFKYEMYNVSSTVSQSIPTPDMIEYVASVNCDALNKEYINNIELGI